MSDEFIMTLRHHSLIAWQRADDFFIKLHRLAIQSFPAHERFELGSQMRRAAYSVAANIVEGFARRHRRARLHYLNISESSLAEVGYCVHVAKRLGYITQEMHDSLELEIRSVYSPLTGLIRSTTLLPAVISGIVVGSLMMIIMLWFDYM